MGKGSWIIILAASLSGGCASEFFELAQNAQQDYERGTEALRDDSKLEEAVDWFDRAIRQDPEFTAAYQRRGEAPYSYMKDVKDCKILKLL